MALLGIPHTTVGCGFDLGQRPVQSMEGFRRGRNLTFSNQKSADLKLNDANREEPLDEPAV